MAEATETLLSARGVARPDRLAFADVLRGMAALIVVLGHFTVLYLSSPAVVAALTYAEPAQNTVMPAALAAFYELFNAASVGVGVFFLISGFVIPLSIETATVRGYFIKRLLRIYPTFWVALALSIVALVISSTWWAKPLPLTWRDYLANTVLVTEWTGRFDILTVAWTLQIELKFYLIAPIVAWLIARNATPMLLVWGVAIAGLYSLVAVGCSDSAMACWGRHAPWVYVAWEGMYLTFMLIGSVFYAHYRRRVTTPMAVVLTSLLFAAFAISFRWSHQADLAPIMVVAYAEGVAIFALFYALRDRIPLVQPFKALADISYPLYVVHPLIGYVCMRILTAKGVTYPVALAVALVLVFSLATAMHYFVEKPSLALGKRLAAKVSRPRAAKPAVGTRRSGSRAGLAREDGRSRTSTRKRASPVCRALRYMRYGARVSPNSRSNSRRRTTSTSAIVMG